jgi:chromosome segregation ATPase
MSKYTSQDVVKIKREIQRLSVDIAFLNADKKKLSEEVNNLNFILSNTRDRVKNLISKLFTSYDNNSIILNNERMGLESELVGLRKEIEDAKIKRDLEVRNTQYQILTVKEKRISAETIQRQATSRADTAISELNDILSKIDEEKVALNNLLFKKSEHETQVSKLKDEEQTLLTRISEINNQMELDILEGRKINKKLEEERDYLRRQIEENRGWERDVKAMEVRLSPEYQEVYNRLPSRRNKI